MMMSDRILGLLGGAMVIGAIALLLVGGEGDTGAAAPAPPTIEMLAPSDGSVVNGPVDVVFRVPAELTLMPGGWGIDDHHLHLSIDGVEVMPSSSDLESLGDGEYRWRLPSLDPGPHRLVLLWSGLDHRPIEGTESEPVGIEVRG